MTDYFLDSVGGSGTSPFDTWAKAATSWSNLTASVTPGSGDRVIVGVNHVENLTSSLTVTLSGCSLISSTVSGTSTITYSKAALGKQFNWSSGATQHIFDGGVSAGYSSVWGINIEAGLDINVRNLVLNDCNLIIGKGGTGANVLPGTTGRWAELNNCVIDCVNTSANAPILDVGNRQFLYMNGGSISGDRTTDAAGYTACRVSDGVLILDGVDCDGFTTDNFVSINAGLGYFRATNCRLNSNTTDTFSGVTLAGDVDETRGFNFVLDNCTSSNTVVSRFVESTFGKASTDTSIYLDASDGTTSYSDKVVTSSICEEFFQYFRYEVSSGFADFSTNKTITINFAQDGTSTNLLDSEIWLEVQYPTSGNSSYSYVNDKASDNQTTANQTTNSESWTGLGGTNTKQELSVTTSSGKEGPYKVFVYVAKPSTTVYIDPKVNIT